MEERAIRVRDTGGAGAPAIGTTSFGVALNHGVWDGEQLPFDDVVAVARSIVGAVDVPVTIDLEAGHGAHPADVKGSVAAVIEAGAVGINIEDSVPGSAGSLRGRR
jgi:2-methylisocitrate lyase-like PEP mutase family enzyme